MKKSILTFLLLFSVLFFSVKIEAKLLPRFQSRVKQSSGVVNGVGISPRLRADRKAITLYLSNLNKSKSVTYTLIYQTAGKDEGVSGSIDPSAGNSARREILFGTCSAGVCRYHGGISNMRLEVITELPSGKKLLRRFRIRV